jgi:hypothetical protein
MDSLVAGSVLVLFVCGMLLGCARAPQHQAESPAQFCARADTLLTLPVADSAYHAALPLLYSCPDEAGRVIARLWESPPADDRSLSMLAFVGGHIHDGRIYEAARAVAADTSRSRRERVAGLFTLVSHYNAHLGAAEQGPYPGVTRGQIAIGWSAHELLTRGAIPLPPNAGVAIAGFCHQLAGQDPDPEMRYVAGELHRGLSYYGAGEERP